MRYLNLARSCTGYNASITFWCLQRVLSNCKSAMKIIIYTYLRVQIYRLFLYKCEPKKILPTRYTFFSVFVMTARAVRRISAYFFCKHAVFSEVFDNLQKSQLWSVFHACFLIIYGNMLEKRFKAVIFANCRKLQKKLHICKKKYAEILRTARAVVTNAEKKVKRVGRIFFGSHL